MSTTNRRNSDAIRINGGKLYLKDGTTDWEDLGEEVSVKGDRKHDKTKVTLMRGFVVNKPGTKEFSLSCILAQSDKAVKDRLDELEDKTVKMLIVNSVCGGKRQAYYLPQVTIGVNFSLEFAGGKHQEIGFDADALPQDSNPSCTASTDLPTDAGFTGSTATVGKNPFYVIIEEAVV